MSNLNTINGIELQETKPFSKDNIYYKGESYTGRYSVYNGKTSPIKVFFETALNNEIKVTTNLPLDINKNEKKEISISFTPVSTGEKSFQLSVNDQWNPRRLLLLKKTMLVQEKEEIKKPNIEASVQSGLPKSMKLGQRAGIIFLFTNKGEGIATGISIEIKQIQA